MGDINFNAEMDESSLTAGDITGADKISRNRGNVGKAGRDNANVNIYTDRAALPVVPNESDSVITQREFAHIDRLTASVERLIEANNQLKLEMALLKREMQTEIMLIRQQVSAPAPRVLLSSEQMRAFLLAASGLGFLLLAIIYFLANGQG